MQKSELDQLHELSLFREMSGHQFERLARSGSLQRYPQNTLLISEGDKPDFLHVLVEGCVDLFASHNNRQTTIDIIRPATTFMMAAVILDQPYLKSARTLQQSRVLSLPAKEVRAVFRGDSHFARAAIEELSGRYRRMTRLLKDQKLRSTPERLANWLLRTCSDSNAVTLDFEKKTLASLLGTTPENLSRALALLETAGVITSGRTIEITDRDTLIAFASPSPLIDGVAG
jgi:CRP/FNR family transcriptional activator FtrB